MKRTFNYTNRRKIERRDVQIVLREDKEGLTFDADLERIGPTGSYRFPAAAVVFVEAYRQNQWMQFVFGTVAAIRPPLDRRLAEFESPEGLLFRVRVVLPKEPERHKLVGEADQIPFVKAGDAEDRRKPIIEPQSAPLDQLLWKLDLDHDVPRLLVNQNALPTWRDFARNPFFVSLVYPEVLRQVLTRALIGPDALDNDEDDESPSWQRDWVNFACKLGGMCELPEAEDEERRREWIDAAAAAFARRNNLRQMADLAVDGGKSL